MTGNPPWWTGFIVAAFVAMAAWWRDKRKGDIDESALVLGKWKELVEQHEHAMKTLRDDFAAFKADAQAEKAALVLDLADVRDRLRHAEKRIGELETENTGLKRAIAQNSRSTAVQLGRAEDARASDMREMVGRLDQAGHNSGGGQ